MGPVTYDLSGEKSYGFRIRGASYIRVSPDIA